MRSRGFWIHSSQRFSLDPVLEVAVELASEVAVVAKVETAPKGPVSSNQFVLAQLILGFFFTANYICLQQPGISTYA